MRDMDGLSFSSHGTYSEQCDKIVVCVTGSLSSINMNCSTR